MRHSLMVVVPKYPMADMVLLDLQTWWNRWYLESNVPVVVVDYMQTKYLLVLPCVQTLHSQKYKFGVVNVMSLCDSGLVESRG